MLNWKFCNRGRRRMFLALAANAEDHAVSEPMTIVVKSAEAAPGEIQDVLFDRSEYWLGCGYSRPSPAMQSQLKLPKDEGLLVEAVQPKSPAAKAGIQQYDVC